MRAPAWFCALSAIALVAIAPPARAQSLPAPLPPTVETLPPADATIDGPPVEYFDLDAWLALGGASPLTPRDDWQWQLLPDGIIYRAYLANPKESRLGTQIFSSQGDGAFWDSTLGGRMGLLRFGTADPSWPQGWQLDVEGSAQVRLDPDENLDLRSVDFRAGAPLTYGYGRHRIKLAYYHLSSHLGDEFLAAHPTFTHVNFTREVLSLGYAYFVTENLRLYGEAGWAFHSDVSENWEFLFGLEYAPARPTGLRGAPFFAVHGHLREELNYSGNFVVQAGWAWRGDRSSHLLRTGLHYYNGLSDQYSFFRNFEQQIGAGVWYDF
jgi:Protein of unknown function (DUF1207)